MEENQGQELREFNRLYKKLEELYHSLSLRLGMSDSIFSILYTICELGDGCSQRRSVSSSLPASRRSTRRYGSWKIRESSL